MRHIYIVIFTALVLFSCEKAETNMGANRDEAIHFSADVINAPITRGEVSNLTTENDITVIAPGYGVDAEDQKAIYQSSGGDMALKVAEGNEVIKRSARNMVFTAWTAPEGVNIAAGTVDFTQDLEGFIGAQTIETNESDEINNNILLEFSHLVAKASISVYDVTGDTPQRVENAGIVFPSLKQVGNITTVLGKHPKVEPGKSGNSLEFDLDQDKATIAYLPPLATNDILMFGSFTVKVNTTTYVGTLNNLQIDAINAGDHLHITIHINDDHTALLQAITLAPWDEYPDNIYNRPSPGLWGMEDLYRLARLINTGEESIDGYTLDDFCREEEGRLVVRQYTDINFTRGSFTPIGTNSSPFTLSFDGNGYAISGISYLTNGSNIGLFGVTANNAVICNVTLKGCYLEGQYNVGAIVGRALGNTEIRNCTVNGGRILGVENVGGFVGLAEGSTTIYNCRAELDVVTGESNIGGFAGSNNSQIGNSCCLIESISCSTQNAGGFVGTNNGVIENAFSKSYFTIAPSNEKFCGAWVGYNNETTGINRGCYWNNDCIENGHCERIVGNNETFTEDGLEILPTNTSGEKYDIKNGRFINANGNHYSSLTDRLNTNIGSLGKADIYSRWAKIDGSIYPIFSYGE